MFPTHTVIIEGPDCSGKTTLYSGLHKKTKFRWNIQDRSNLSMVCYARQFGRPDCSHRERLAREILDLNNRVVVVLPPKSTVLQRLRDRGDECQDSDSLTHLYDIFAEEAEKIRSFPNVLVVEKDCSREELVEEVFKWLHGLSLEGSPIKIGRWVRDAVVAAGGEATVDVRLQLPGWANSFYSSAMNHPRESEYYSQILDDVIEIFRAEFAGENPYRKPQDVSSRRFYYASSSCISSVHFLVRDDVLNVLAVLRSTDVHRNASIDLQFLCYLSTYVLKYYDLPAKSVDLAVRFNCAHVRLDLPAWDKNEELE